MREGYPCDGKEDDFIWSSHVIGVDEKREFKVSISALNPICQSCDNYKGCYQKILDWAIEEEKREMQENQQDQEEHSGNNLH